MPGKGVKRGGSFWRSPLSVPWSGHKNIAHVFSSGVAGSTAVRKGWMARPHGGDIAEVTQVGENEGAVVAHKFWDSGIP